MFLLREGCRYLSGRVRSTWPAAGGGTGRHGRLFRVSLLGESVRLSMDHLEELRRLPSSDSYRQLTEFDAAYCIDLDRFWKRLAPLMDAAAFPVNPITGGSPFPDERRAWTKGPVARWLSVQEVALVAGHLNRTSYDVLVSHIRAVLEAGSSSYVDDEWVAEVETLLAEPYRELVDFYKAAAIHGQCTIFWAA
ncbi:DUF1877 family protein [Micromonospora sp. NPDC050187]|uniref:DUF1877 family protein n=1 Tax=Micromonospora sp. NPDC050187 TaxID=3364277 RepID=UPI0037A1B612